MKSLLKMPMLYTLLLLAALLIYCKPKPEPVSPVVKPTPPVSTTTPPSSTTVSSATTVITDVPISTTAPLPPEGCLVTRIIYKAVVRVAPIVEAETFRLEGTTYTVALKTDTRYYYDNQKRLVREVARLGTGGVDSVDYRHETNRIYKRTRRFKPDYKSVEYTMQDTIRLNAQGLAEGKDTYFKRAEYDAQGYLLRYYDQNQRLVLENKVVNGNTRTRYNYIGGEIGNIFEYMSYDTLRPSIPNPFNVLGKPDQNLLRVTRLQADRSYIYPNNRDIYRLDHFYVFNQRGLVEQLFRRALSTGYDLNTDSGGIGVFTYEYECP